MKEWITSGNIALLISIITALYAIFKAIAEKTENKIDDQIVDGIEKARVWLWTYAQPVWCTVEQLGESGAIKKSKKFEEYMAILKEVYKGAFKEEMPKDIATEAGVLADGMSAADKLAKNSKANPQTGQDVAK